MEKIYDIKAMQQRAEALRLAGKRIGFVPTMGYLHEGHLSLLDEAKKGCDITVLSIFVNPTQFGPNEDFNRYPRDLQRDMALAETRGTDIVFIPKAEDMYPGEPLAAVEVSRITEVLCGASRKGHFRGVTTVVSKLFNIVKPHVAVFGQKDAQQAAVIMKMVQDLNIDIEIRMAPIVREADGLAMSSRNVRLRPEDRRNAAALSRALFTIRDQLQKGKPLLETLEAGRRAIRGTPGARLEYLEARGFPDMKARDELKTGQDILIAIAVHFSDVRLIDNVIVSGS